MTDDNDKCARLIHREIEALRELTDTKLAALRVEMVTVLEGKSTALKLQAKEYERRLETLNHAHQQAVERYAQFLPREIHDQALKELEAWRRTVDTERANYSGQRTAFLSVLAMAISLVSLLIVGYGVFK